MQPVNQCKDTDQEYSCSVVYQKSLFSLFLSPPLSFYKSILCTSILSTALAGAQHDPVTPTMAAWQSHLGVREGLEPLGSDLEG